VPSSTYRCATNVRNSVACCIFGSVAKQNVGLGVIFTLIRGFALVGRHDGAFVRVDLVCECLPRGIQNFGGADATGLFGQPENAPAI
jgi:hypothetical protein